jgi:hypothetical protein
VPTTDIGGGYGTYNPIKLAGAKGFVKAGAGESKFGFGGGGGGGGSALLNAVQEDEALLETGFCLDVWDPMLWQILAGEI